MLTETEQFTFFWNGPFSNWHMVEFDVRGVTYNCMEQFMMAQKAILFGDEAKLLEIMASTNPKEQKALGRDVSNFNKTVWDAHRYTIVYSGNLAKFQQNVDLYELLMATELKTLVEASPFDDIWGIGMGVKCKDGTPNPDVNDRTKWKGINLLGQVLTHVRETLKAVEFNINGFSRKLDV